MNRRSKRKRLEQFYRPSTVQETCWLESDVYDKQAWRERARGVAPVAELIEAGEALLPHFASLIEDIFCALFKLNVIWRKPSEVRPSAALNRVILERLLSSPAFQALRRRTVLEEDKAAIACVVLGERTIELIRSERFVTRRDILDLWDLQHQEEDLAQWAAALKPQPQLTDKAQSKQDVSTLPTDEAKARELWQAAERAARVSEARLRQKAHRVEEALKLARSVEVGRLELASAELAQEIEEVAEDAHQVGLELAGGRQLSAAERLELGRRLSRNKKLGELARLVGRFKQLARAIRRRTLEKGVAEAYDITRGADVGRLIPAELLALNDRWLRAEFKRRLLEGTLLQYELRQQEEKGKGPVVVCLDVSSSMAGDKELWGKAVTLTLLDIARRQRRLFRAVLFSAGPEAMRVFDLNRERRYETDLKQIVEMAEYFPGGGTDFEAPLIQAVELLKTKALKRADVVLITDGECEVSPQWLENFAQVKQKLAFNLFAVLIDVGASRMSTLVKLADRITTVSKLTAESARGLFVEL